MNYFVQGAHTLVINEFQTTACDLTKICTIYLLCGRKLGPDPWVSSGASLSLPDFS